MTLLTILLALQVVHREQVQGKKAVLQEASTVDDMYDMLAVYEQKVPTADQVCASGVSRLVESTAQDVLAWLSLHGIP